MNENLGGRPINGGPKLIGPHVERQLLARIQLVQRWVSEFGAALGRRRLPRVKTRLTRAFVEYAPIENRLLVPAEQLLQLSDSHLRLAIAHEMGHFARRWPSLFAWTLLRRLNEEVHADRYALLLTGASLAEWSGSVVAVAAIENPGEIVEDDVVFQRRKRKLSRWLDHRNA